MSGYAVLVFLALILASATGVAADLRIAARNLEHLDDADGAGCVGRTRADYVALGVPGIRMARRNIAATGDEAKSSLLGQAGIRARAPGDGVRDPARHWLSAPRRPEGPGRRRCLPALGYRPLGNVGRSGIAPAVPSISNPDAGARSRTETRNGRRFVRRCAARSSTSGAGADARRAGGGRPSSSWGDFNRRLDAIRRLGVAAAVAALGAAASTDRRRPVSVRSALPGIHRPHGRRRRRGNDAGDRLVPRGPSARPASRPLRDIGGVPSRRVEWQPSSILLIP